VAWDADVDLAESCNASIYVRGPRSQALRLRRGMHGGCRVRVCLCRPGPACKLVCMRQPLTCECLHACLSMVLGAGWQVCSLDTGPGKACGKSCHKDRDHSNCMNRTATNVAGTPTGQTVEQCPRKELCTSGKGHRGWCNSKGKAASGDPIGKASGAPRSRNGKGMAPRGDPVGMSSDSLGSPDSSSSDINSSSDGDGMWAFEAIISERGGKGGKEYLVKWEGYPSSKNTWEPAINISPGDIQEFLGEQEQPTPVPAARTPGRGKGRMPPRHQGPALSHPLAVGEGGEEGG
jgi:hypothetical protein